MAHKPTIYVISDEIAGAFLQRESASLGREQLLAALQAIPAIVSEFYGWLAKAVVSLAQREITKRPFEYSVSVAQGADYE